MILAGTMMFASFTMYSNALTVGVTHLTPAPADGNIRVRPDLDRGGAATKGRDARKPILAIRRAGVIFPPTRNIATPSPKWEGSTESDKARCEVGMLRLETDPYHFIERPSVTQKPILAAVWALQ